MLKYIKGDATKPEGSGPRIIIHVCNDIGAWGKGFVLALSKRWSAPERRYRDWYQYRETNNFGLGKVQLVLVESNVWVANMVCQHGIRGEGGTPPIRYDSIEIALKTIYEHAKLLSASVHLPRIGCGLAGGKWEKIEELLQKCLLPSKISVTVYDLD